MQNAALTDAEARYLKDLQRLRRSTRVRVLGWALELVPGIALFSFGLLLDNHTLLVLGFLSQLYFSLWRMYGQWRGFRFLQGIAQKALVLPPEAAGDADGQPPPG